MFNKYFRMNEEINYFTLKMKVHQLENKKEGAGVGERKYKKERKQGKENRDKERKRGRETGREGVMEGGRGKLLIMKQIPWSHLSCSSLQNSIKHPRNYSTDHDITASESLKNEDSFWLRFPNWGKDNVMCPLGLLFTFHISLDWVPEKLHHIVKRHHNHNYHYSIKKHTRKTCSFHPPAAAEQ